MVVAEPALLPLPTLSSGERQFIESVSLVIEQVGFPRIGGRLVGLMVLAPRPLALEEIAALLKVSRASVSINTRLLIAGGVLKPCAMAEDRRRFYTMEPNFFEHRIQSLDRYLQSLRTLSEEGMHSIAPENTEARQRLQSANLFATFLGAQVHALVPRLRELFAHLPPPAEGAADPAALLADFPDEAE